MPRRDITFPFGYNVDTSPTIGDIQSPPGLNNPPGFDLCLVGPSNAIPVQGNPVDTWTSALLPRNSFLQVDEAPRYHHVDPTSFPIVDSQGLPIYHCQPVVAVQAPVFNQLLPPEPDASQSGSIPYMSGEALEDIMFELDARNADPQTTSSLISQFQYAGEMVPQLMSEQPTPFVFQSGCRPLQPLSERFVNVRSLVDTV